MMFTGFTPYIQKYVNLDSTQSWYAKMFPHSPRTISQKSEWQATQEKVRIRRKETRDIEQNETQPSAPISLCTSQEMIKFDNSLNSCEIKTEISTPPREKMGEKLKDWEKPYFRRFFQHLSPTKMSYFMEKCEFKIWGWGTAKENLWRRNSEGNERGRKTFDKRMSFRQFIFLIDVKKQKPRPAWFYNFFCNFFL